MSEQDNTNQHPPQPCMFCSNMAGYSPLEEMTHFRVGVYFCHPCNAEYLYYRNGERASWSLYTELDGKTYRWTVVSNSGAYLFYVKEPGIPGVKKNDGLTVLMYFERDAKLPNITPQNLESKIRIWLPFL